MLLPHGFHANGLNVVRWKAVAAFLVQLMFVKTSKRSGNRQPGAICDCLRAITGLAYS